MCLGRVTPRAGARPLVASVTRVLGFEVAPKGLYWGIRPRRSRRPFGDATGEIDETGLVGEGGRQGDLDAGDHFGDTRSDLDQTKADRVELGIAPKRGPRRQPTQGQ